MPSSWKWKTIIVLFATIIAIYILIPTVFNFKEIREKSEDDYTALPWYVEIFPERVLNLGLDLRGGIYIEMEVDIPSAIKRKLDIDSKGIESSFTDENIGFESIVQPAGSNELKITFKSMADLEKGRSYLSENFNTFQVIEKPDARSVPVLFIGFTEKYNSYFASKVVDQALETIRNRIDRYGVAEPTITKTGKNRIAIELPGISDPDRAINLIKKTGQLEFRIVDETVEAGNLTVMVAEAREKQNLPDNFSVSTVDAINEYLKNKIPENSEISFELQRDPTSRKVTRGIPYLISRRAEVTGDMLENAVVNVRDNEPFVSLTFDKQGTKLFGELTKNNVGKKLAIVLDGNVMKAPTIQEAILQGQARITLGYGDYYQLLQEADDLALILQEGALPATMHEATKTVVGPTLGRDSIEQGIKASILAAVAVFLFMIIYYKLSGVWANIALIINVLLLLAVLSIFQATLTLPGIAGIVLTIGMAVDANVIINERIREEINLGRTPTAAVENGYSNALSAVFDANLTTLIAGIILYQFGTGPIKGFAVTLSIGIITTLFTAIIITRLIFDYRAFKDKTQKISI